MAKKIPDNIECLSYDDILENGMDENDVHWFRCKLCLLEFGSHQSVPFPKACPNCGELFFWKEK